MVLDLIENNAVKWAMLKLCGNYLNINSHIDVCELCTFRGTLFGNLIESH